MLSRQSSQQSSPFLFPEREIPSIKRGVHMAIVVGLAGAGVGLADVVGLADIGASVEADAGQGFTGAKDTILQRVAVFLLKSCWRKIKIFSGDFKLIFSLCAYVPSILGLCQVPVCQVPVCQVPVCQVSSVYVSSVYVSSVYVSSVYVSSVYVSSVKYQVPSVKYQVLSVKYQVLSVCVSSDQCQVSNARWSVPGDQYQVISIRWSVPGVPMPSLTTKQEEEQTNG